eukprot:scaffold6247_cov256-Pinguiococcus_pyrenoidosus.AAC.7
MARALEQVEKLGVLRQRHLQDLGHPLGDLLVALRVEEGEVQERRGRRHVGAESVLRSHEVDACMGSPDASYKTAKPVWGKTTPASRFGRSKLCLQHRLCSSHRAYAPVLAPTLAST